MKKIITLLMLLFVALQGNSQGLNTELGFNDEYNQLVQGVACDGIYTYLMIYEGETGTIDWAGIGSSSRLKKIDTLGNIMWDVVMAPGTTQCIHFVQMAPAGDGGLYLFGHAENHCAHSFDGLFTFLQKRDSSGNEVWTIDWVLNHLFNNPFSGFTLLATGDLLLNHTSSTGSWVYTISPSGVITDSMLIAEPKIEGFAELSGFEVTGFRNDSLMGFDSAGMLIQSITFSTPVQGINSMNDTLYVLTQDSIFSFSGNLQPLHESAVTGYSLFGNLKVDGQNIRFLSHDSLALTVITLDRQLQVTGTLTIPENIGQDAYIDFNDLHLSAGITFNLTEFSAVRFLNYSMNSTQNVSLNRTDIGVINLKPTLVTALLYGHTPTSYTSRMEADVQIRNYGPDTLHSCRITRFNGLSVMVNPTVYAQEFHNLNLAPGDSMWLSLGAIFQGMSFPSGNVIMRNICIHTNHPNGLVDLNVSNDEFCKEIIFGYVGIEEAERKETFSLYPNPTTGVIRFNLPSGAVNYGVYNLHGQLVHSGQTTQRQLDLTLLPAGMYVVRIHSLQHKKEITGKVVIVTE